MYNSLEAIEVDTNEWIRLVRGAKHVTIFHKLKGVIGDALKIVLIDHGEPVLGIPLHRRRKYRVSYLDSWLTSLPYLGMAIFDQDLMRSISRYSTVIKVLTEKLSRKAYVIRLSNPPYIGDIRPFIWAGWMYRVYYSYYTVPSRLRLEDMHRTKRKAIRKIMRSYGDKVEIRTIDPMVFREEYRVFAERKGFIRRAGLDTLEKICIHRDNLLIKGLYMEDELVAGELFLLDRENSIAYRMYAFTTGRAREKELPSYLLYMILKNDLVDYDRVVLQGAMDYNLALFVENYSHGLETYYNLLYCRTTLLRPFIARIGF